MRDGVDLVAANPLGGRQGDPPNRGLAGLEIIVPGSTSNLGPGFDVLGLALQLTLRVRIAEATDDNRGHLEWRFRNGPLVGDNSIATGFRAGVAAWAPVAGEHPSLVLDVSSDIPMRAGLGSSAAAFVAGLRLAEAVSGRTEDTATLLALAAALEGHPDNTSASVLGGFVVSSRLPDGRVLAETVPWPAEWPLIVATPDLALETKRARAALPQSVPLEDAVNNLQRTALLITAVHRRDARLLADAFVDRLHQPYRAALVPGLADALGWKAPGLLGVFLSGAGPSIAAVVDTRVAGVVEEVNHRFERLYAALELRAEVRRLEAFGAPGP